MKIEKDKLEFVVMNTVTGETGVATMIQFGEIVQVEPIPYEEVFSCIPCNKRGCCHPYWNWKDIELSLRYKK